MQQEEVGCRQGGTRTYEESTASRWEVSGCTSRRDHGWTQCLDACSAVVCSVNVRISISYQVRISTAFVMFVLSYRMTSYLRPTMSHSTKRPYEHISSIYYHSYRHVRVGCCGGISQVKACTTTRRKRTNKPFPNNSKISNRSRRDWLCTYIFRRVTQEIAALNVTPYACDMFQSKRSLVSYCCPALCTVPRPTSPHRDENRAGGVVHIGHGRSHRTVSRNCGPS